MVDDVRKQLEELYKKEHHYDIYGHQPGCGVCGKINDLRNEIRWLEGCPKGHPWRDHKGYVGGFSGWCPDMRM